MSRQAQRGSVTCPKSHSQKLENQAVKWWAMPEPPAESETFLLTQSLPPMPVRAWGRKSPLKSRFLCFRLKNGEMVPKAAAARSLQSSPTLCDPTDGSPPGSAVPGFSRQDHCSGLPLPSAVSKAGYLNFKCVRSLELLLTCRFWYHRCELELRVRV